MNELFPWEDTAGPPAAQPAPAAEDTGTVNDAVAQATGTADTAAVVEDGDAPEPPEPEVQPDGDPREMEQTTPPAETPDPGHTADPESAERRDTERADRPDPASAPTPPHGDPLRVASRERPVARKEYYSIGEVSELVGLPAHVLRYWESQFGVLNPSKNRSGNRAYQRKEIKLILLVKHLLYDEKYTVEGAKAKLDQLRRGGELQPQLTRALDGETVKLLREEIAQLKDLLTIA